MLCCVVCRWGVCTRFPWVRPRFGRSPRPPPPDPLPLRQTAQNFAFFFPSPATIFFLSSLFFSSLGCLLVEFWWCSKRRDPEMSILRGPKTRNVTINIARKITIQESKLAKSKNLAEVEKLAETIVCPRTDLQKFQTLPHIPIMWQ